MKAKAGAEADETKNKDEAAKGASDEKVEQGKKLKVKQDFSQIQVC